MILQLETANSGKYHLNTSLRRSLIGSPGVVFLLKEKEEIGTQQSEKVHVKGREAV